MKQSYSESFALLENLVHALDNAFISSWQSTAAWQKELTAGLDYVKLVRQQEEDSYDTN